MTNGVARCLGQIRSDAIGDVVGSRIYAWRERAGSQELRLRHMQIFTHGQTHGSAHRRLDSRATDFAIALRGVTVAHREERAGDLNREIKSVAFRQIPGSHVAAMPIRWNG